MLPKNKEKINNYRKKKSIIAKRLNKEGKIGFKKGHKPYITINLIKSVIESNKRRRMYKEIIIQCYCGKNIKTNNGPRKRKFCSMKCRIKNQLGKSIHIKHGLAIARRNKEKFCEKCGSIKYLNLHHKDRNITNNFKNNLITLCRSCHNKEHIKEIQKGRRKKIRNETKRI